MEKIIYAVITVAIGALVWYMKYQTKRDATREERMSNFVDTTLKDLGETVKKDSENTKKCTEAVGGLKSIIQNGLIHAIKDLTKEIRGMNGKR